MTMFGIEEAGGTWDALSLNRPQTRVINHLDGVVDTNETQRNMMKESARIAGVMGANVVACGAGNCIVDSHLKCVSTPAYMLDATLKDIAKGIAKLAEEVVRLG